MKKDLTRIFIDEIYSKPPKKIHPTNKIVCNHIDETWSVDLADMIDYKFSINKGYRYILIIIDNFSKCLWTKPLKNKYSQTIKQEFSNILTTSKPKPLKLESDRGTEFYNNIFQNFLRVKNIHHVSRFTDKGPSIAERVIRTIRNLLKQPIVLAGNADWLSELSAVVNKYNNSICHSIKMTLNQASKNSIEKEVYSSLQDKRRKLNRKFKRVFSKCDSTNYSYKLYTITEVLHDTIPSYRLNYLSERYDENLLLPTKLTLEEKIIVMKELNLIQ